MQAIPVAHMSAHRPFYNAPFECILIGGVDWPIDAPDKTELLKSLPRWGWKRESASEIVAAYQKYHRGASPFCHIIDVLDVDVGFGSRWFHIWWDPLQPEELMVVKELSPCQLVVFCRFASVDAAITASLSLLSGEEFATFEIEALVNQHDHCLTTRGLKEATLQEAFLQGMLESRHHEIKLHLDGFEAELPGELILWEGSGSMQALEDWLAQLRAMSAEERLSIIRRQDAEGTEQGEAQSDFMTEPSLPSTLSEVGSDT